MILKKLSTSITLIGGDFNAKVGKTNGIEKCIGKWSRGRTNNSGTKLIEFCEIKGQFITNSSFRHPARHITTWSSQRKDPSTNMMIQIYNQIDYILMDEKQKQTLIDARSYSGTETYSDHRLVVTRIQINWAKIYKRKMTNTQVQRFNNKILINDARSRNKYQKEINQRVEELKSENKNPTVWTEMKVIIKEVAKEQLGYENKEKKRQVMDRKAANMSKQQQKLRLQIENTTDINKINELKKERKRILKNITKRVKEIREKEIEDIIKEVEDAKDDTRMFKAVKKLNQKKYETPYVHNEKGQCVTQTEEIYKIIEKHFKNHFQKQEVNPIQKFTRAPGKLNKQMKTKEVQDAVQNKIIKHLEKMK